MSSRHKVVTDIPDEPIWVGGDPRRLEQVFNHVLTNAIRYSPADEPIELRCTPDEARRSVTISVMDRGPGISAKRRKELLERFYPSVAPKTGGLGVGLYISRVVVEAHGGHLTLDSHLDEGTTVTIVLPM
jgi:signal transduction histidine kinase